MKKHLSCLAVVLMCCGVLVGVPASPGAAASCTSATYRAGTSAPNITVATGVNATIETPSRSDVWNYDSQRPTGADIFMFNQSGGGGFVQVGWYLGSASGLPNATQPRVFWGENTPSGEALHAGPTLSWGTIYSFMITNPLNGANIFNIWFQGTIIDQSNYAHSLNAPAFNGEVDNKCTRMFALASHYQPPLRTLQYRYGSWAYFSGTQYTNDSAFISTDAGDVATNFSYGGG